MTLNQMEYSKCLSTTILKQNDSGQIEEEEEEVNVWKHQTQEESEEEEDGGRPATGQTNTPWFLFSMAT